MRDIVKAFRRPPAVRLGLRGLSRLGPADVEMIEHYRHEKGIPEPVVFAGDTPGG